MIVVDSSVWISYLCKQDTAAVQRLRGIDDPDDILVGDLILLEVLQGARDERHAATIERHLRQFEVDGMLDDHIAVHAARNDRKLRELGVTIRKTADVIIGTFCMEGGHSLLHQDRDFDAMAQELGLTVI